uniref:Ig-like domain-containing protein n=1 Tax=Aquila chrysaetos chrysaetos TaxID=223781 RepID=A0A663F543_AQUCH
SVVVACLVDGYFPEPVKVTWDSGTSPAVTRTFPASRRPSGTYTLGSQLRVTSGQPDSLQCTVEHPPSGFKKTTGIEGTGPPFRRLPPPAPPPRCPALADLPAPSPLPLFILPPTPSELYVSQNPKLRCLATSLPSDEGVVVSWTRKRGGTLRPQLHPLRAQFNGTFTATSEVPISTHDWEGGETFTCTINHAELPSPISRSISKKPGKRLAPSVYLLAPPSEELSGNRDTLSLTCLVRGFYPEDISVEWQKNQETLDASTYDTVQPLKEKTGDASYFLYSRLVVKREEWNRGTTFVCMVVHEGQAGAGRSPSSSSSPLPDFSLPEDFCYADPEKSNGSWDTIAVFITLFLLSVCYSATITLFKVRWGGWEEKRWRSQGWTGRRMD